MTQKPNATPLPKPIKPANYSLRLPPDYLDEPVIPAAIGTIDAGSDVLILGL